jgi:hypothetical protein
MSCDIVTSSVLAVGLSPKLCAEHFVFDTLALGALTTGQVLGAWIVHGGVLDSQQVFMSGQRRDVCLLWN